MKDFEFYRRIRVNSDKVYMQFSSLYNVYNKIPETTGCIENLEDNACCGAWCCKTQTPQQLYSEFLLMWKHVVKEFSDDQVCELFRRCMLNAVNTSPSKGCVFFDKKKKQCTVHNVRPFNCRIYGITPTEDFSERYNRLKEQYKNDNRADFRPQCNLVSTLNKKIVTSQDIDLWWNSLVDIEKRIGISNKNIHDGEEGSYRTPHDHVLLYNMPDNVLAGIAGIKMYNSHMDKVMAIDAMITVLKEHFKKDV